MARSKQFDEGRALEATMKLFWRQGYSATSMQDLEKATGLNRTSIYNAFGNKRSLFKAALTMYIGMVQEKFQRIFGEPGSCRDAVRRYLQTVIELHFSKESPGGCLVVLSVMESSQHDTETLDMAKKMFQAERRMLVDAIEQGKKQQEFSEKFDAQGAATAIAALAAGMVVLAKADTPVTVLSDMVRVALKLLDE